MVPCNYPALSPIIICWHALHAIADSPSFMLLSGSEPRPVRQRKPGIFKPTELSLKYILPSHFKAGTASRSNFKTSPKLYTCCGYPHTPKISFLFPFPRSRISAGNFFYLSRSGLFFYLSRRND